MKKCDFAHGLFWLSLGLYICFESVRLRLGAVQRPGAGFMPFLSGLLMGFLGLLLFFQSFSKGLEEDQQIEIGDKWKKGNLKIFFFTLLACFGYLVSIEFLGFILTTFIFLYFLFKVTAPKRWLMPLLLTGAAVTVSYLVFIFWLKCQFPKGFFKFY